jgi:hypothetical protein
MNNQTKPKGRRDQIVEQEVDGEILIYDLRADKALCLNKTSALIWQSCDGKRTVAQINDLLGKQLQTETNEDIVWLALDQLSKEKLIEPTVDVAARFGGMSRRQIIKNVGLGSVIALPVVASLVAPSSASAQTCTGPVGRPPNAVCTQSCQCTTGCCCSVTVPSGSTIECRTMVLCAGAGGTCVTF